MTLQQKLTNVLAAITNELGFYDNLKSQKRRRSELRGLDQSDIKQGTFSDEVDEGILDDQDHEYSMDS